MVVKFIWPSISISSICIPQGRRHVIRLCGSLVHSSLLQFVIKLWHRHFFFWFFVFCLFSNNHFKSIGLLGKHFNLCFIFSLLSEHNFLEIMGHLLSTTLRMITDHYIVFAAILLSTFWPCEPMFQGITQRFLEKISW